MANRGEPGTTSFSKALGFRNSLLIHLSGPFGNNELITITQPGYITAVWMCEAGLVWCEAGLDWCGVRLYWCGVRLYWCGEHGGSHTQL